MCRLYDAASSFTYLAVEFEVAELEEVEELDPLARLFEIARRARDLANEQQVIINIFFLFYNSLIYFNRIVKLFHSSSLIYFTGLYSVLYCYQRQMRKIRLCSPVCL